MTVLCIAYALWQCVFSYACGALRARALYLTVRTLGAALSLAGVAACGGDPPRDVCSQVCTCVGDIDGVEARTECRARCGRIVEQGGSASDCRERLESEGYEECAEPCAMLRSAKEVECMAGAEAFRACCDLEGGDDCPAQESMEACCESGSCNWQRELSCLGGNKAPATRADCSELARVCLPAKADPDAGTDGSVPDGTDAGRDGGTDAGRDGGTDAGAPKMCVPPEIPSATQCTRCISQQCCQPLADCTGDCRVAVSCYAECKDSRGICMEECAPDLIQDHIHFLAALNCAEQSCTAACTVQSVMAPLRSSDRRLRYSGMFRPTTAGPSIAPTFRQDP